MVRCTVCFENKKAALIGKNTRPPPIATEGGTQLVAETIEKHLKSATHAAALNADIINKLQDHEREKSVPIRKMFSQCSEKLAKEIGAKMIEIYAEAKRGASGWSWPARHAAHQIAEQFQPNETHADYVPTAGSLTYVNPCMQRQLFESIVKPEFSKIKNRLENSLAVSLRVDGSVDRMQVDNVHCMLKVVDAAGIEDTIFVGFAEPDNKGTEGYVEAIKKACANIIKWSELLPMLSSVVTDGESLNTGKKQSLWASLDSMKVQIGQPSLLKIWCSVHRSNLVWNSVTSNVSEIKHLITDAKSLSAYYRCSGLRTKQLKSTALNSNVRIVASSILRSSLDRVRPSVVKCSMDKPSSSSYTAETVL
jgi:hypothetical protein